MSEEFEIVDGPVADIDLDIDGKQKHELTGKIALIDADTIAYTVCLSTEQQEDLLSKDMYTEDEWLEIKSNPNYDEELHCIWTINLDVAYEKALGKLDRIYDKTGCRECELHFTTGKNFRYVVDPNYKANRTGRRPTGLKDMKLKLLENFNGSMTEEWEADDVVVHLAKKDPKKYTLCATDKDVLYAVPGIHFNYYERAASVNKRGTVLKEINMTWLPICTFLDAIVWPFTQAIIGDTADNIEGIKGMGKVAASKAFAGCANEEECWRALVLVYESKGKTSIDALITMRLVYMHQFDGEKIKLFDPRRL